MIIFIDSADIKEIAEINELGLIDGVTTNPSLLAKNPSDFKAVIGEICNIVNGHVSAEVSSEQYEEMIKQGEVIYNIADNIVLKLPVTAAGLKACRYFSSQRKPVNMTLCFSASQALLAAKAGATYISPFIGRHDDINQDGLQLIADIKTIYDNYPNLHTKILAASIRHPYHFLEAMKIGAEAATMPGKIIKQLLQHPLTDTGLKIFKSDWEKSGLKI